MCDIVIVRTESAVRWSEYFEGLFTDPENNQESSNSYTVGIISICDDGKKQIVKSPTSETKLNELTSKVALVIITPSLLNILMEHPGLSFFDFNPIKTKAAMFLLGVQQLQMFELDSKGCTLSERFSDYANWLKYDHDTHLQFIETAIGWISSKAPKLPERKTRSQNGKLRASRLQHQQNRDEEEEIADDDGNKNNYIDILVHSDDENSKIKDDNERLMSTDDADYVEGDNLPDGVARLSRLSSSDSSNDNYCFEPGDRHSRGTVKQFSRCLNKSFTSIDDFRLIPSEAKCEDVTSIVIVFKKPPVDNHDENINKTDSNGLPTGFKAGFEDENGTHHFHLNWLNPTVCFFEAPSHHPASVQVKIFQNNEDIYGGGVNLEYRRSLGVDVVVEVSQIYIHLLASSLNIIKTLVSNISVGSTTAGNLISPSSSSSSLLSSTTSAGYQSRPSSISPRTSLNSVSPFTQLDKHLANLFKDTSDVEQFSMRAFEYFFGAYSHIEGASSAQLPTIFHLAAEYNLIELTSALLDLPDSMSALSLQNSSKMTPLDIAKASGSTEITNLFVQFLSSESDDDSYVIMENKTSEKKPEIITTPATPPVKKTNDSNALGAVQDDDSFLNTGAIDKSQEELISIIEQFKKNEVDMTQARTLFNVWQLRHGNDNSKKQKQSECSKHKESSYSFRKFLNKMCTKTSKNIGLMEFTACPVVPPRPNLDDDGGRRPAHQPPLPRRKDLLTPTDKEASGEASAGEHPEVPVRPPPRKTPLKGTKQISVPNQLNPPIPINVPRKCSLPENVRRNLGHFTSRLDSTTEQNESTGDNSIGSDGNDGYISMGAKSKYKKSDI